MSNLHTADLILTQNGAIKHATASKWQFYKWKCLVDERVQEGNDPEVYSNSYNIIYSYNLSNCSEQKSLSERSCLIKENLHNGFNSEYRYGYLQH